MDTSAPRPSLRLLVPVVGVALVLGALIALALPATADGPRETVIVTFDVSVSDPRAAAQELAERHDGELRHVYAAALRGFAAEVPRDAVRAIERDHRVVRVELDEVHHTLGQDLPTGIDRIETDRNPTVETGGSSGDDHQLNGYQIAVLDTGIQRDHEDLNVAGGYNFTGLLTGAWDDDHGHGTHVAGTIGAIDNNVGVVGVAPGASLWALKVCNLIGSCFSSDIVAGIDWMTQRKTSGDIDFAAANFSISSADSDRDCSRPANATHEAICGAVDAGIVFVLAAGNDDREKTPYPVAFSVSAIADFDGGAGGAGEPTCRNDTDDTLADFSNYGEKIDIAAPGVCILSTWNDGGYNTISGTSMATPHAAGAVALYLHANGLTPAQDSGGVSTIEDAIVGAAHPQGTSEENPCSYDDSRTGGPLLFVNHTTFGGDGSCGVAGQDDGGDGGDENGDDDGFLLDAEAYKVRGINHVDLTWTGSDPDNGEVDVYRDGSLIATTTDDGSYTDDTGTRGGQTFTYQVCDAGTDSCSNEATVET